MKTLRTRNKKLTPTERKRTMNKLALLSTLAVTLLPASAFAHIECAGETHKGDIVKVSVETVGTMGAVRDGLVTIQPKGRAEYSYVIRQEDIMQMFEHVNERNTAVVGVAAYYETLYPITIRYVGPNYDTQDLADTLRQPGRKKFAQNEMYVWKGPGFQSGEQYSFTDVVCNVMLDP
jgi:hypothetical protein